MNCYLIYFFPYTIVCIILTALLIRLKARPLKYQNPTAVALSVLAIAYFFFIIYKLTTSYAFTDDYNLLDSFHRMLYAEKPIDKIKAFFEQVNEHRFAFERVLMYLTTIVWGRPDLKVLIVIGNLFLVGILWLFYRFFRWSRQPLHFFTPVALLLFNLSFYENAFWAIAAIQNTPLIFFAMLTVWLLAKGTKSGDSWALASAMVTTFVSGSGLAIWIIGAILLTLAKRYRFLVVWMAIAVGIGLFYFTFDYRIYPRDRSNSWLHPFSNLSFFFNFLGSVLYGDFHHGIEHRFYLDSTVSVLLGGILFLAALRWFFELLVNQKEKHRQAHYFMTGTLLFLLLTGAMLVASRPIENWVIFGGENISQRYILFSVVLCAAVYLLLLYLYQTSEKKSNRLFKIVLLSSLAINVSSYFRHIPTLIAHKASLELDPYYIENYKILLTAGELFEDRLFWNHPTKFTNLDADLRNTGLYNPPNNIEKSLLDRAKTAEVNTDWKISARTEKWIGFAGRNNPIIHIYATGQELQCLKYFILQSDHHQFILPASPVRGQWMETITNFNLWTNQFTTQFYQLKFPSGSYKVLVVPDDDNANPVFTGKMLHIREIKP